MPQANPISLDFNPVSLFNICLDHTYKGDIEGWLIQEDTSSPWNHVFMQLELAFIVSQGWLFSRMPLSTYLKPNIILGFWQIKDLTSDEWNIINNAIQADLHGSLWNRMYNLINLLGQALRQYWISMPGQDICSQRVAKYLRLIPRLQWVIPSDPSPGDLGIIFNANPDLFLFVGYWWKS